MLHLETHAIAAIIAAGGPWGAAEDLGVALALASLASGMTLDIGTVSCFVEESNAANRLKQIGYARDVNFICQTGLCDVLPFYDGGTIRLVMASHD